MLRLGDRIMLASEDRERLQRLSGQPDPGRSLSVAAYTAYLQRALAGMPERTADERLMKFCVNRLQPPIDPAKQLDEADAA